MTIEVNVLPYIALAAAGAVTTAVGATMPEGIAVSDYYWATGCAILGIAARHFSAAGESGKFEWQKLAFDIPTAPVLGVAAYAMCVHFVVEPAVTPFVEMVSGLLGPSWIREVWAGVKDVMVSRLMPPGGKQ